jgi:peptide/nickel transport system ATP-binding protein
VYQYPHEFSGGMRQRAMIAMAIANQPALLIADEPTTALDVTIQAQVMEVLAEAREATGAAMILITHDLGLVAGFADRIIVMYGGRRLRGGRHPHRVLRVANPYTRGCSSRSPPHRRATASGCSPSPVRRPASFDLPEGCAFAPLCASHRGVRGAARAVLEPVRPGHWSRCTTRTRCRRSTIRQGRAEA